MYQAYRALQRSVHQASLVQAYQAALHSSQVGLSPQGEWAALWVLLARHHRWGLEQQALHCLVLQQYLELQLREHLEWQLREHLELQPLEHLALQAQVFLERLLLRCCPALQCQRDCGRRCLLLRGWWQGKSCLAAAPSLLLLQAS